MADRKAQVCRAVGGPACQERALRIIEAIRRPGATFTSVFRHRDLRRGDVASFSSPFMDSMPQVSEGKRNRLYDRLWRVC